MSGLRKDIGRDKRRGGYRPPGSPWGEQFQEPVVIDSRVIRKIKTCCNLAPLHNPANLDGIRACGEILKNIKQAAVFDTAFHQSLPRRHLYTACLIVLSAGIKSANTVFTAPAITMWPGEAAKS